MTSRLAVSIGLTTCFMTLPFALFGEENPNARSRSLSERLRSPRVQEREAAFDSLQRERQSAIQALLEVASAAVRQPHERYARTRAILLLGEYRALEAVKPLADQVSCSGEVPVWEPHPLNRYPAAYALVQIGSPSIRALLDRVAQRSSEEELRIIAFVVYMIDGKELGLTRLRLALGEAAAPGPRKDNLLRLIDVYKPIDFHNPKQWPRPASPMSLDEQDR